MGCERRAAATIPQTAQEQREAGLSRFDYWAPDQKPLEGPGRLARMKSVLEKAREGGCLPLPENEDAEPERGVQLGDERPEDLVP